MSASSRPTLWSALRASWGARQLAKQVASVVPSGSMAPPYARTGPIGALVAQHRTFPKPGLVRPAPPGTRICTSRARGTAWESVLQSHKKPSAGRHFDADCSDTAVKRCLSMLPFTEEDFAPAWLSAKLIPALGDSKGRGVRSTAIFSFTPDGFFLHHGLSNRDHGRLLGA